MAKYKVLQAEMVKGADRERASAVSSFILSGDDAHKLAGHEGFSYQVLDSKGRIGVVRYKGVEVSLLFKREILEREPWPSEPVPARVLSEPKGAWIQIDLLDTSDVVKQKGIADRLKQALDQNERLKLLWQYEENRAKNYKEEVDSFEAARKELKVLREKIALMERERALTK